MIHILQAHPYSFLFVMILIEELGVFLPFSGDNALLLFGVWSRQGRVDFVTTLAIVCVATLIGSSVLYYVSRWLGRMLLTKYSHLLRYMHITQENIDLIERWMAKYGWATLILARLTPGLRIVGTVAAGVLNVPFRTFLPATMVGTVLWAALYYFLGSFLGRRYADKINSLLSNHFFFVELMAVNLVLWFIIAKYGVPVVRKWYSRRMAKK